MRSHPMKPGNYYAAMRADGSGGETVDLGTLSSVAGLVDSFAQWNETHELNREYWKEHPVTRFVRVKIEVM